MMPTLMRELARAVADDFSAVASSSGDTVEVVLRGTADHGSMAELNEVVQAARSEGRERTPREAVIDLRELEFMSSAGIKAFISWINELQELPDEKRYALRFVSNPAILWQKRSLKSLQYFAVDLITIDS